MHYGSPRFRGLGNNGPLGLVGETPVLWSEFGERLVAYAADGSSTRCAARGEVAFGVDRVVTARDSVSVWSVPDLALVAEHPLPWRARSVVDEHGQIVVIGSAGVCVVGGPTVPFPSPRCAAVSPDGRQAVVGGEAGDVQVIDLQTGATRPLKGARSTVYRLAWSADGAWIAAGCATNTLVWPSAGGKSRSLHKGKRYAHLVGFAVGNLVVAEDKVGIVALDPATGVERWRSTHYGFSAIQGDRVVSAEFEELRVFDGATGAVVHHVVAPTIHIRSAWVVGDRLYASTGTSASVRVADLHSGAWQPLSEGHHGEVRALHEDGDTFATAGSEGRICVWRRGVPLPVRTFDLPTRYSASARAVFLQGDHVWAGVGDTVVCWRVSDGALLAQSERLKDDIELVYLTPDGLVATAESTRRTYGEVYVLDPASLVVLRETRTSHSWRQARPHGAGLRLVAGAKRADLVPATGVLTPLPDAWPRPYITVGCLPLDERFTLEWRSFHNKPQAPYIELTRVDAAGEVTLRTDVETLFGKPALEPNGNRFATPHADHVVRIWSVEPLGLLAELPQGDRVETLGWFADGTLWASTPGGDLYEVTSGR